VPALSITGLPASIEALLQPRAGVALASAYPLALTGQMSLTFAPNAVVPADDPAIQFATGGRTVAFTIPANSTQAVFPGNAADVAFQTGTVAGTITLSISLQNNGSDLPLSPNPNRTLVVSRRPPQITAAVVANKSSSGFEVQVTAFATPRSVTTAIVSFYGNSGASLKGSQSIWDLGGLLNSWYQSAESAQYGSQFKVVFPYSVTGNINDIASLSVVLINDEGSSSILYVHF
jgi:hypothetical protein